MLEIGRAIEASRICRCARGYMPDGDPLMPCVCHKMRNLLSHFTYVVISCMIHMSNVYVCVCIYIYIYIYMHIHTYITCHHAPRWTLNLDIDNLECSGLQDQKSARELTCVDIYYVYIQRERDIIHTYTHTYVYTHIYTMYVCIYIYIYIHIYIYIYTLHIRTYIRTYVRTYIHTYIHTYIYVMRIIVIVMCKYV